MDGYFFPFLVSSFVEGCFWDPLRQAERCCAAEEGERRAAAAAQQAKLAAQQAEEAQFSRLAILYSLG